MPMVKNFTLIYFENDIQCKFEEETKKMGLEPSEQTVNRILNFARSYDVMETKSAGDVEMILN